MLEVLGSAPNNRAEDGFRALGLHSHLLPLELVYAIAVFRLQLGSFH